MNNDGSVVVGAAFPAGGHAVVWTRAFGAVDLNIVLPQMGVNLQGWVLTSATAVSGDGSQISGTGVGPGGAFAWTLTGAIGVPAPASGGLLLCVCGATCRRRRR
ncbi:MAG: hypothetical protein QM783_09625 [Phycisphaerales bacterium]